MSKSRAKVLVKELSNSQKKIESYQKEIDYLEAKVDQGDQMVRIQQLQDELYVKNKEEEVLKKEIRMKAKKSKIGEKKMRNSLNDQSHTHKLNYLIEESKFLKKQAKTLAEKQEKDEANYEVQLQFAKKLEERYKKLCSEVGEPEAITITWEGEKVEFKKNTEKPPAKVKPKEITKVSQYWTEDSPDNFQVVMNPKHFEGLKNKIRTLKKSLKIKRVQHESRMKKLDENFDKLTQEGDTFDEKKKEKDKEYELLVIKLGDHKKGLKHNALLPLENLIRIKELEDEEGKIIMKLGNCETLIPGDEKVVRENPRIRVRNIKMWLEENSLIGFQCEYTPHLDSVFYGKLIAALPKVFPIHVYTITKIRACHNASQILGLEFVLRDGTSKKYGVIPTDVKKEEGEKDEGGEPKGEGEGEGEDGEEPKAEGDDGEKVEVPYEDEEPVFVEPVIPMPEGAEVNEIELPDYDRILKIHVYGQNNVISGLGVQITVLGY